MNDWDIRLECTVCGQRKRRCRSDGCPPFGREPMPTVIETCYQCSHGVEDVKTLHFVDYASEKELAGV